MANILSKLKAFSAKCGSTFDALCAALAFAFMRVGLTAFGFMALLGNFKIAFPNAPVEVPDYAWTIFFSAVPISFVLLTWFHLHLYRTKKMTLTQFWAEHPNLDWAIAIAAVLFVAAIFGELALSP